MSSYVESVLADDEHIVHRAAISHWKFFFSYFIGAVFLLGAFAALTSLQNDSGRLAVAGVAAAIGLVAILSAVIRRRTTELVLTDRRIITKRGLVSRDTVEMNLNKVESLHVDQTLLGRILGYGDVTVVGTGSSLEPLLGIAGPIELRKKLGETLNAPSSGRL